MATGPNPKPPPRKPNRRSRPGVKKADDQMQSHSQNVSGGGGYNPRKKKK